MPPFKGGAEAMDAPEREPPQRQRSTHRFEKGFTDWRTNAADKKEQRQSRGGGSGSGGGGATEKKNFSARRRERRRRRYQQVHSSSLTELKPGKDADEALPRHHSDPSSSRPKSNKRSGRGDDAPLNDSSKRSGTRDAARDDGPSLTSLGTDETNKLSNTTKATMDKYKTLYEAMLRDIEKDESDTTWVGLGDVSKENAIVAREIYNAVADRKTVLPITKGHSSFHGTSESDGRRRGDQARKSHSFRGKKGSMADQISSKISSEISSHDDGSGNVVNLPRRADGGPSATRPREDDKTRMRRAPPPAHKPRRNDHHSTKADKEKSPHDMGTDSDVEESSFAGAACDTLANQKSLDTGATHVKDKPRRGDRRSAKTKREKSLRSINADGSSYMMKPKDKIKSEIRASFQRQGKGEGREESQRPRSSSFHGAKKDDDGGSEGSYQTKKSSSFHGTKSSVGDGLKSSFKSTSSDGLKSSFKSTSSDGLKISFKSTISDGLKSSFRSVDKGKTDDSDTRKQDGDDKAEAATKESSYASISLDSDDGSAAKRAKDDKCKSVRSDLLLVDDTIDGLDVEEVQLDPPSMDMDDAVGDAKEATLEDSPKRPKRSNRKATTLLTIEAAGADHGADTPVKSPKQKIKASSTNNGGTSNGSPVAKRSEEKDIIPRKPSVRFTDCDDEFDDDFELPPLDEDSAKDSTIEDDKSTDEMAQSLALVPMKGRKKRSDEGDEDTAARSSSKSVALNVSLKNPNEMALVPTKARRKRPESERDRHCHSGRPREMPERKDSERNYRQRHRSRKDRSPSPSDGDRRGGRDRDRSRSPSPDSSVDSRRSNRSGRSSSKRRSGSRLRLPSPFSSSMRSFKDDASEGPARPSHASDDKDPKQKKGLFRKIKKLAGKVKNTLGEIGGIGGVHKYQLGEWARYRVSRPPRCLRSFDPVTMTVEVQILSVHTDAVLEMPYYTIRLPDDTSRQTNWDNLMTLSQYKKILAAARAHADDPHYASGDEDEEEDEESSSRWFRPLSRSRGSSRHRGRERSDSRHDSRGRPSSRRDEDDYEDERSTASRKSSRSSAASSSSHRPSSRGGRPRSPSPSPEREGRDRPRASSGKRQSSRAKPRERSPSPGAEPPRAGGDARAPPGRARRPGGSGRRPPSSSANHPFSGEDGRPRRERGRDRPRSSSTKAARGGDGAVGPRRPGKGDRWKHHRSPTRVLDELESSTRSASRAGVVQEDDF